MYCECFAVNSYCNDDCDCSDCRNNKEHKKVRDVAVEQILERNQEAFSNKIEVVGNLAAQE